MTKSSESRKQRKSSPTQSTTTMGEAWTAAEAHRIQALILGNEKPPTPTAATLVKHLQETRKALEETEQGLAQSRANTQALEQRRQSLDGRMSGFIDLLRPELRAKLSQTG